MPLKVTLASLVSTVAEFADNEDEIIATVMHLLSTQQVHLRAEPPVFSPALA